MNDQASSGPDTSIGELAVEPLDPVMLAEVLEALAGRLGSLEVLVAAMTDQFVEAPAGGPWSWRQIGRASCRERV